MESVNIVSMLRKAWKGMMLVKFNRTKLPRESFLNSYLMNTKHFKVHFNHNVDF